MKKVLAFFLCLSLITVSALALPLQTVDAKHKAGHGTKKSPALSGSVAKNRRSLTATFSNLTTVKSISYTLTYDTDRGPQGASGTIKVGKSTGLSRTLLFGTCSHKVCTYHKGVKNIKLSADFNLKTGGVISYDKSFK